VTNLYFIAALEDKQIHKQALRRINKNNKAISHHRAPQFQPHTTSLVVARSFALSPLGGLLYACLLVAREK
jgi:hypothetical protein